MDAEREIRNAQQAWARSRGIPFYSRGYVREVEANLWQPLSPRALQGFERGAGSELSRHMRVLHSSSALAANFFDYWAQVDARWNRLLDVAGGSVRFFQGPPLHDYDKTGWAASTPRLRPFPINLMTTPTMTGQEQELSFDGLNRHRKLKCSWAVDLGPFKPRQHARQYRVPQDPAGERGAAGNGSGAPLGDGCSV